MARISRLILLGTVAAGLAAPQSRQSHEQEPPEEDREIERVPEYTLNPLQADKELTIGKFYFRRGSFKAAARRFEEATKWNPGLAEAYLRLGEAQLKLKDAKAARAAFEKFLELEPDGKNAANVRKRLRSKSELDGRPAAPEVVSAAGGAG
ncbi:MAG TPA: tetratricopeptide repeat protein [Bryobacteraceae bacterium]|nr:tetratricopeptide repeat protein [Bryobacteraceae bacterium]